MDQVSQDDTATEVVRARRKRMRATARGLRGATPRRDAYETPQWLDRSFVLPLSPPQVSDVPSQSMPHHDDFDAAPIGTPTIVAPDAQVAPAFVRPATPEIDFARVIRRADLSRSATRTALGSTAITGLVLIAYLLTSSPVVLGMGISFAVVAVLALAVRVRLSTAAIPYVR